MFKIWLLFYFYNNCIISSCCLYFLTILYNLFISILSSGLTYKHFFNIELMDLYTGYYLFLVKYLLFSFIYCLELRILDLYTD